MAYQTEEQLPILICFHDTWCETRWCSFPDIVFCILYIDELLTRLKHSEYGGMVGHVYCGAFACADDIALVAPTTRAIYVRTLLMSVIFSLTRRNVNLSNMANPMMYLFISMER